MKGLEDWSYGWRQWYAEAPAWIGAPMGALYGRLPMQLRYGSAYEGFLREARLVAAEQVRELAEQRLRDALSWAVITVPAYRHIEERLESDASAQQWLAQFPLTSKSTIQAEPSAYLSRAIGAWQRIPVFTSGPEAVENPFTFYLQRGVSRAKHAAYTRAFGERVHMGAVTMSVRGRDLPDGAHTNNPTWAWDSINRMLWINPNHLTSVHMLNHMQIALRHGVCFIQGYSSAIYRMACWLRDNPNPRFTNEIRAIQLMSENAERYMIEEIQRVFDCPVIALYGHSERAVAAGSMPDDARYFVWPQYGHLELVDAEGQRITAPDVPGEIVATGFDNHVMPLVRYRTGDTAVWSSGPEHPNLPGYPVLERIDGQANDYVVARDGRQIAITSLGGLELPGYVMLDAIQYEQFEPGKLIVCVDARDELSSSLQETVRGYVRTRLQGLLDAELRRVTKIERTSRGKRRLLIQHIPPGIMRAASDSYPAVPV